MILTWDTETQGLVKKNLPLSDPKQPHLVQLAALLFKEDGTEVSSMNFIIQPDGWTIPPFVAKIHGISTERALRDGVPAKEVLKLFLQMVAMSDTIVAHNIEFDIDIIKIALLRNKIKTTAFPSKTKNTFCTMKESVDVVQLSSKGRSSYKFPKMEEAYEFFTGEKLHGAHDAVNDVRACKEVYLALKNDRGRHTPSCVKLEESAAVDVSNTPPLIPTTDYDPSVVPGVFKVEEADGTIVVHCYDYASMMVPDSWQGKIIEKKVYK